MRQLILLFCFFLVTQNLFGKEPILSLNGLQITTRGDVLGETGTLEKPLWKSETNAGIRHFESTPNLEENRKFDVYLNSDKSKFLNSHVVKITTINKDLPSAGYKKGDIYSAFSQKVDKTGSVEIATKCENYSSGKNSCHTLNRKFCADLYVSMNAKSLIELVQVSENCEQIRKHTKQAIHFLNANKSSLEKDHSEGIKALSIMSNKKVNFDESNNLILDNTLSKTNVFNIITRCNQYFWKFNEYTAYKDFVSFKRSAPSKNLKKEDSEKVSN